MDVQIVIPFRLSNPKSRLADHLSEEERKNLAVCMLKDVLAAVCNYPVTVVMNEPYPELESEIKFAEFVVDSSPLNDAVNTLMKPGTAVVMSDLPLLTEEVVERFLKTEGDVVIAPGRRGGTNMLLARKHFRVSYHYGSFLKHLRIAESMGLKLAIFDSFYASVDVDDYSDLLEVMLHCKGETKKFLQKLGFKVIMEKEPYLTRDL